MKISLTELVDIVAKAGVSKATKVSEIEASHQQDYSVAKDFYKQLRTRIVDAHKNARPKAVLDNVLEGVKDPRKLPRYQVLAKSYQRWWGRNNINWFQPPAAIYKSSGVSVVVNPELGLEFPNERIVVKLYFKKQPLRRQSADLITALMAGSLRANCNVAVLDVERRKIFLQPKDKSNHIAMIDAELAYVAQLTSVLREAA